MRKYGCELGYATDYINEFKGEKEFLEEEKEKEINIIND